MSTYTLYTDPGNFRAFKILIAAEYNSTDIKTPKFELGKVSQSSSSHELHPKLSQIFSTPLNTNLTQFNPKTVTT